MKQIDDFMERVHNIEELLESYTNKIELGIGEIFTLTETYIDDNRNTYYEGAKYKILNAYNKKVAIGKIAEDEYYEQRESKSKKSMFNTDENIHDVCSSDLLSSNSEISNDYSDISVVPIDVFDSITKGVWKDKQPLVIEQARNV